MVFFSTLLKNSSWVCLLGPLLLSSLSAQINSKVPYNNIVLQAMETMPLGGGYSTGSLATQQFRHAVTFHEGTLCVKAAEAKPSFCSEATYLVFLKTILLLQERRHLSLTPATLAALQPKGQADGEGIWGRWNANGPGVARLFQELHLGKNFTSLAAAEPGDFLKIFWSNAIGACEHGHLVIYLNHETKNGIETITFWSSNQPGGYGKKTVPLRTTHHLMFSRLTNPLALEEWTKLPRSNSYLASLLTRNTTWEEVTSYCDIEK